MMSNVNVLLSERLKKNEKNSKMSEMARQSASGKLTSFSGVFSVTELNESEKNLLEAILLEYATKESDPTKDLISLTTITSEVKAINNQAAILHGERIKLAQDILKPYKDGAFTTWLMATYGNRQTPYNFLSYYEFYTAMPKMLRSQMEAMPRQAIYTLATREGDITLKRQIIENYNGETKSQLLNLIRETFPLKEKDLRKENIGGGAMRSLIRLIARVRHRLTTITKSQKNEIFALIKELTELVETCKTR